MTRRSRRSTSDDAEVAVAVAIESPAAADVVARLRRLGQRVTMQRVAILSTFATGEHLAADEVYDRVAPLMPLVNGSTVYRALEHFRDVGLLSQVDVGDGLRRFELLGDDRHHHLVCLDCKHSIPLDDDVVEPLRRAIEERHRFKTRIDHLAIFGTCEMCENERKMKSSADSELSSVR